MRSERLGVITRERQVRVLDCSVTGCLLETNQRVEVGAVATIHVTINGRDFSDDVQFVRCQAIAGAGASFHVGARFLWTQPLRTQSLRRVSHEPSLATIS